MGHAIGMRSSSKSRAGSAIYDANDRLCAVAEGLWLQLRDPSPFGAQI